MQFLFALLVSTGASFQTPAVDTRRRGLKATEGSTLPEGKHTFTVGVLGDLHMDPRDMDDSYLARDHFKNMFQEADGTKFLVSLGDVGESKDCTETKQLYAGTSDCFKLVRGYLDGFEQPFDLVGGNHDLEGIDEFVTDEDNLKAYLEHFGKETPQFCHQVAEKTLLVGLGSTVFRRSKYTSHEVFVDDAQFKWFEQCLKDHPAEDDWKIFVFTHAPIIGSGLRVLQECHVVNGCCWLNHGDHPQKFIELVRDNPQVKCWMSGHFHLSLIFQCRNTVFLF